VCVILPPFIPAPKGDWVFWREAYKIAQCDHLDSKATSGETKALFLSEPANRLKSCTTKDTNEKFGLLWKND